MIRLKVFISSVQKEMQQERGAVGRFLTTDDFLRDCTSPRLFEKYPQPLRPNPDGKGYLDLLRTCQVYLLIIGSQYGGDAGDGLSATHEEYRLAQELNLPTLVCIKGPRNAKREKKSQTFIKEVEGDNYTYSRFMDDEELLKVVGERLRQHIRDEYDTVPLKAQVEQSKRTRQAASPFEQGQVKSLSYDDLDEDLARDMIAAAEETDKERFKKAEVPRLLLSRGYLWQDGSVSRPTIAGALLLAERPGVSLPQARIQLDAFSGTERNEDAIDSTILDGPLPRLIEQSLAFIRRNTPKPMVVKGLKRQNVEAYPTEAVREALVNAVAHRDYADAGAKTAIELYSDRLLVISPGDPPGGQTVAKIASGNAQSRSRNPLVVQGMTWLDFMDERGSGIARMTRVMEQAGHPKPSFRSEDDSLVLELRPAEAGNANQTSQRPPGDLPDGTDLDPREKILAEVKTSGSITTRVCVQRLGIPSSTAKRHLSELVDEKILKREGTGRGTRYRPAGP